MGSDLARISFDRTRGYRSVIAQQGRVTLEADTNEASHIAQEALRHETIDIVGAAGTPDGGYAVSSGASASDIVIGAGTMYLGGWQLRLETAVHMNAQPDWLNLPPGSPNWQNLPTSTVARNNRAIVLLATDQSLGAVEDRALREVALGGPDTAARSRLMQHFLAVPVTASTCAAAAREIADALTFSGLKLDAKTNEVTSDASLEVSFFPPTEPTDACSPTASGGYLGADNQLVRVTVVSYDAVKQSGTLLWGWNNASTLFRASVAVAQTATQPATLTLSPSPVDAAHTPQQGQVVEVLRTECVLGNAADQNFVAAAQGQAMTLATTTSVFNPDQNALVLSALLPADYATEPNSLFVRLWQAEVPFVAGKSVQLDTVSGLAVTVTLSKLPAEAFASAAPVWHFAVRPNTPQQVYPERYQEAPQPPDGPRQWLCDLAVISVGTAGFTLLEDCRKSFLPLIDQDHSACCGVVLTPRDVIAQGGLQAVVDGAATRQVTVSLRPGTYTLRAPLALTSAHDNLTLEGCGPGVILTAEPAFLAAFTPGLITINGASGVSVRHLTLPPPRVPLQIQSGAAGAPAVSAVTMCGIRITTANNVTIEDCTFDVAVGATVNAIAACIFAQGACSGLALRRNHFNGGAAGTAPAGIVRFVIGLWQSPAASGAVNVTGTTANIAGASFLAVDHALDNSEISANVFSGLTIGGLVIAQLGLIRCGNNKVAACCGGFWFVESAMGPNVSAGRRALADETSGANANVALTMRTGAQAEVLAGAVTYANLLGVTTPPAPPPPLSDAARAALLADFATRGGSAYDGVVSILSPAAASVTRAAVLNVNPSATTGGAASVAGASGASVAGASVGGAGGTGVASTTVSAIAPDVLLRVTAAHDLLETLALALTRVGTTPSPALYLINNDIELASTVTQTGAASLPGLVAICTQGALAGSLFLQGNRVEVPTTGSVAMVSMWAARTIVTGNQFNQLGAAQEKPAPCAISLTDAANLLAVTGNIVHRGWVVYPPRNVTNVAASSWEFLNTVG